MYYRSQNWRPTSRREKVNFITPEKLPKPGVGVLTPWEGVTGHLQGSPRQHWRHDVECHRNSEGGRLTAFLCASWLAALLPNQGGSISLAVK